MGKLLIVTHRPAVGCEVARTCLDYGHAIRLANGAREACRLFPGGAFDAIVIDAALPFLDGATLVRVLRRERPDMPIVALVGDAEDLSTMQRAGASSCLARPADIATLARSMATDTMARQMETATAGPTRAPAPAGGASRLPAGGPTVLFWRDDPGSRG